MCQKMCLDSEDVYARKVLSDEVGSELTGPAATICSTSLRTVVQLMSNVIQPISQIPGRDEKRYCITSESFAVLSSL